MIKKAVHPFNYLTKPLLILFVPEHCHGDDVNDNDDDLDDRDDDQGDCPPLQLSDQATAHTLHTWA